MPTNSKSLAERVEASYLELSATASELNKVSDELGKPIAEIDFAFKKLNLGITVWVDIGRWSDQEGMVYEFEQVGYAKVGGKWGMALRTGVGNHQWPDDEKVEEWLFSDGPRKLRLSAIEKVPELLSALSKEAVETTKKTKDRLVEVQEVAAVVKKAALEPIRKVIVSGQATVKK
jgi:hypothetical protein